MLEPQSDRGWEKQLTRSRVGGQPLLTQGLGQLCGPGGRGGRKAGGRHRSSTGWAASSHPTTQLWIPGSCSCTAHSFLPPGVLPPYPSSASGHSHAHWADPLYPPRPALTLGPQAEEMELEVTPDVWKKNKKRANWSQNA